MPTITGTEQNDTLVGGDEIDQIFGLGGRDILRGGLGNDALDGGDGVDTADYSDAAGPVTVDLAAGVATGAAGSDTLTAIESVRGSAYDDILTAGTSGGSLVGGRGLDILIGGNGADAFEFDAGDSTGSSIDSVRNFGELDRLIVGRSPNGSDFPRISIVRFGGGSLVFANFSGSPQTVIGVSGVVQGEAIQSFLGSLGGGIPVPVQMVGSDGNDNLIGSQFRDELFGGGGDDILIGGSSGDAIAGGGGRDVFVYRAYQDSVRVADPVNPFNNYDNLVEFETGIDQIDLTAVASSFTGGVSLIYDGGSTYLFGSNQSSFNFLITAAGRTINLSDLVGLTTGVYIVGSSAAEVLNGGARGDNINAGAGDDVLTGVGGADALTGAEGADTYRYLAASDSTISASDRIFGFVSGQDRIDLTAVRSGAADRFGIIYGAGGGSFVFVDLGGDGANDMLIQVVGTVTVADIVWTAAGAALTSETDAAPNSTQAWMTDWKDSFGFGGGQDWLI